MSELRELVVTGIADKILSEFNPNHDDRGRFSGGSGGGGSAKAASSTKGGVDIRKSPPKGITKPQADRIHKAMSPINDTGNPVPERSRRNRYLEMPVKLRDAGKKAGYPVPRSQMEINSAGKASEFQRTSNLRRQLGNTELARYRAQYK